MSYLGHLIYNWRVAMRALLYAAFHFAHGLVPTRWTRHETWGLPGPGGGLP